jgi:plastocyanin
MCPLPPGLRKPTLSLAIFLFQAFLYSAAAMAATKHVDVGNIFFRDVESGTTTTTINVGDTIVWDWVQDGGTHTTTSGTCSGVSCSPDDPTWNAPIDFNHITFSRTFTTPGVFPYFCVPHQAFMQGTIIVTADFTVSVSDADGGSMGSIFPGQQNVFDGTVVGTTGYSKTVTLSCQSGTSTLPSPCTPNNPQNGTPSGVPTFNFTITAGANSTGHYSFTAQGSDGTLTHFFQNLNFDVVDFGIDPPSPVSVTAFSNPAAASTSSSASVNLTAVGNLPDSVTVSCESNDAGATCTPAFYNPIQGAPVNAPISLSVPANTAVQDSSILLDATSDTNAGSATKKQTLALHVVQLSEAAFAPSAVTIGAGNLSNSASTQLTIGGTFVSPPTATMACTSGLPSGGACSFSPNSGVVTSFPSSQAAQSVVISVPFNTPAANPTVTVSATANSGGASLIQSQPLTLHIPAPALSLSTPSPVNMVNNSFSSPVSVQIIPTNLAGTVALSCSNLPANVVCHFLPSTTIAVNGGPVTFAVVFEANGATPGTFSSITINANTTINGNAVSSSVPLPAVNISAPGSTTDVSLGVTAVNMAFNSALINFGDPNLTITASVTNSGSTYSAAVWDVGFSNPVVLVPASATNATCSQLSPTAISCSLGDVANGSSLPYSFKVMPLFERSLVISNWVTSPTVGDSNLTDNSSTPPTVQVRPRPLARRGLAPKTP